MRDLHARMLGAVLGGEGLQGLADMAAAEAGGPVAIVLPARGIALCSPAEAGGPGLTDAVSSWLEARANGVPGGSEFAEPVTVGDRPIGAVLALGGPNGAGPVPAVDPSEVLRAAAVATLAEVAVADARDEAEHELRASLLEDLRDGTVDPAEVARRAARLGCELSSGAIALIAEIETSRPRHAAALIEGDWPGSLAELVGSRLYAVLPGSRGDGGAERTAAAAARLVARLRAHGPAGASSFYPDPAELHEAMREAELVLEVVRRDHRLAENVQAGAGDRVYRLLLRALVSHPEEVRHFYEDTIAPVVVYDREYRGELLGTLDAYLDNDCNMNATARAIYAHRHTIAYRLDRVRELTGLDPSASSDRERLGLGIKAYRILAPTLPH